jgi:pyruvate kinase
VEEKVMKNGSNGHSVVQIPVLEPAGRRRPILTNAFRRTRIVCTLGPSCREPGILRQMVEAGMDVARFNFSHGDYEFHSLAAAAVREAAAQAGRSVALMQDLQGPKLRIGALVYGSVDLVEGRQVELTSAARVGDATTISVPHPELVAALRPGDRVLLADGELELCVLGAGVDSAVCTVARGGLLGERKGIAVPGRAFDIPVLTDKDLEDLWFGRSVGFDFVALSFVRSAEDVRIGRTALERIGWDVPIVAKLETQEALDNLDGILAGADAVMVARGDLGVELPIGEVPAAQKDIIHRANLAGVPVITATEMLQSMVTGNRPTRAEASDVATAVWDGTDAVMLSGETSAGDHPLEAVRAMAAICQAAEGHSACTRERTVWCEPGSVASAVAHGAAIMADELGARAIVVIGDTHDTALRVSKAHPATPVIAATPCDSVARRMALLSGVVPLKVSPGRDKFDAVAIARRAAVASGLIRNGDRVVVVASVPTGRATYTDLVTVESIKSSVTQAVRSI